MSLQFDQLSNAQMAYGLNLLAMFLACAGAWLLLATRQREQQAGQMLLDTDCNHVDVPVMQATQQLNRFFYQFGLLCLASALLLSWFSRQM
jgi:hypothetical protein